MPDFNANFWDLVERAGSPKLPEVGGSAEYPLLSGDVLTLFAYPTHYIAATTSGGRAAAHFRQERV